jgi:hypothetical protein
VVARKVELCKRRRTQGEHPSGPFFVRQLSRPARPASRYSGLKCIYYHSFAAHAWVASPQSPQGPLPKCVCHRQRGRSQRTPLVEATVAVSENKASSARARCVKPHSGSEGHARELSSIPLSPACQRRPRYWAAQLVDKPWTLRTRCVLALSTEPQHNCCSVVLVPCPTALTPVHTRP